MEQVLGPTLKAGNVIMDNLSSHKRAAARMLTENADPRLVLLPPYSPDFNPIEKAFAKLKALLRKAAGRTVDGLWTAICNLIGHITPTECRNYFNSCGHDPV